MSDKKKMGDGGVDLKDKEDIKIQKPRKYKVVFHNDDFTPMDFVVIALVAIFRKSTEEAFRIMMNVHEKGRGIAGVYPKGIAETKIDKAMTFTKSMGFPFLLTLEKE